MCIVIDINTLVPVFNEKSSLHVEFIPLRAWLSKRHGFVVFGGTTYINELKKTYRHLRLFRQMKDSGMAISVMDDLVDAQESVVKKKTHGTDCDDPHIIALLGVSRCPLLCSHDARSFKYIRDKSLYPKGAPKVKIYTCKKNQKLLKPMKAAMIKNQA